MNYVTRIQPVTAVQLQTAVKRLVERMPKNHMQKKLLSPISAGKAKPQKRRKQYVNDLELTTKQPTNTQKQTTTKQQRERTKALEALQGLPRPARGTHGRSYCGRNPLWGRQHVAGTGFAESTPYRNLECGRAKSGRRDLMGESTRGKAKLFGFVFGTGN